MMTVEREVRDLKDALRGLADGLHNWQMKTVGWVSLAVAVVELLMRRN